MPCNYKDYPPDWFTEIRPRILRRAGDRCERCGLPNYAWAHSKTRELCLQDEDGAVRVILTVAHKDHDLTHNEDENLAAWCQKCHNGHDGRHRAETRLRRKAEGNLRLKL